MVISAKQFSKREELELELVKLDIELTPNIKPHEISGTREELERLYLSDRTIFHGIKCVITDSPTVVKTQADIPKPQRGEIGNFGLNGVTKKPK